MDTKFINKYKDKPQQKLILIAQRWCNNYIRKRDEGKGCVSCDSPSFTDAGHFYSAGHYSAVRFNENNIHGQCARCNRDLHGNGNEYRRRIAQRITEGGLIGLDVVVDNYRRNNFKWDKMSIIETIYRYQNKFKEIDY